MVGLQPLLNDLDCILSAPIQVWSRHDGMIVPDGAQGIYLADTRLISAVTWNFGVEDAHLLARKLISAHQAQYLYVLRNEDMRTDPEVTATVLRTVETEPGKSVGIVRHTFSIRNEQISTFSTLLVVYVHADAEELDRIKSGHSAESPTSTSPTLASSEVTWGTRHVSAQIRQGDFTLGLSDQRTIALTFSVVVPPHSTVEVSWSCNLMEGHPVVVAPLTPLQYKQYLDKWKTVSPNLSRTPVNALQIKAAVASALGDLDGLLMSHSEFPTWRFLAAGAPWFFTLFGRDSLIAARFLLDVDASIAAQTVALLAQFQGHTTDSRTAEQPGKILHEVRRVGIIPDSVSPRLPPIYYGTIDATLLWISLFAQVYKRDAFAVHTGLEASTLLPQLRAALRWLREFADADGDGFIEYIDESGIGLANQGWKDSADSIRWANGEIAQAPIALCEVQGYAYRAAMDGAYLLEALDPSSIKEAEALRSWARSLQEHFRQAFWVTTDEGNFPAIALDCEKRPVDSLTSNIGHLIGTGILNHREEEQIVKLLLEPPMFNGLGVRTVSDGNRAYWPMRYHVGSVWPHDTGIIIEGMMESGFYAQARTLACALLDAATRFDFRLPELFSGLGVAAGVPVPYPAACRPQAWSAAAVIVAADALVRTSA